MDYNEQTIKDFIASVVSPENKGTLGLIKIALQLIVIASGYFILWRIIENNLAKQKQQYEIDIINKNKDTLNQDNLD